MEADLLSKDMKFKLSSLSAVSRRLTLSFSAGFVFSVLTKEFFVIQQLLPACMARASRLLSQKHK